MAPSGLKRQFLWTSIPAGTIETIGGQQLAVYAVLLTPRLLGPIGTTLTVADFGMQTWPERFAAVRFEALRGGTPVSAQKVPFVTADGQRLTFAVADQLAAWKALFPGDLLVRPYQPTSYSGRAVQEFPASEAGVQIRNAYGDTARVLAAVGGDAPERHAERRSSLERITAEWQAGLWPDDDDVLPGTQAKTRAGTRAAPSALRRAYDFYRRDGGDFTPLTALADRAAEPLDFHDVVARLADHPVLLRALGLVIDLAVPIAQLGGTTNLEISTKPRWPTPDPTAPVGWSNAAQDDVSPRTAYTLTATRFLPAASAATPAAAASAGLLPLTGAGPLETGVNPRFEIVPFDVDGAALRLVSAAESDRGQRLDAEADALPGLPTLRSVGFALVDKTRGAEHTMRLARAEQRATVDGLLASPLTADNLSAGYRVDIFDETARAWRSLCQRKVGYSIGGAQIGAAGSELAGLLEEGYVRPDSLTTGAAASDAVYLHQTVARWDGWSLVLPRPERVVDPIVEPPQPFSVFVAMPAGSLPRLRFGREYRLRVRLADLAGGGLRAAQLSSTEQQTQKFTHRRFEPIPPPELAPTRAYGDGEGQHRIVIRSDRNVSADNFATAHGYRAFDLRYLYPPKCALALALQYDGTFDAALGPAAPASEITRLFETATRADRDLKDAAGATVVAGADHSGDYIVLPEAPAALPWLADPGSRRMSILVRSRPVDPNTGLPGETQGFVGKAYTWKGLWPDVVPIALRVIAAAAGCTATMDISGDRRTLTIALGPAQQATLDLVSGPSIDDVAALGMTEWAGATTAVIDHVYAGKNAMVTPPRTITVVHAVQRPLVDPSGRLLPKRQAGDTHVVLDTSELKLDIPSTGRIDVRAEWTDQLDVPSMAPTPQKKEAVVGSYDIEHKPLFLQSQIRQELGDTRRRRVTYNVKAVSRFHDYFGRLTAADSQACTVDGTLAVTDIPSSARPPAPMVRYVMPTFRWSREGEGTPVVRSTRRGGGLRVFLERPWFASGEDEALAVLAWPHANVPTAAVLRHLSLAGRDPTWDTGSPPSGVLAPNHFNAASSSLEFLREGAQAVSAVVYPVSFDAEVDCWYADLDLSPLIGSTYFPFVRLGLARYQANTVLVNDRLSAPIVTEPLQVMPTRDLTVTRGSGRAAVTVNGAGPGGSRSTTIQAELQAFEGNASAMDDALIGPSGWRTIVRKTGLLGSNLAVDIPQSGAQPLRIAVTEAEPYPGALPASPAASIPARLVYADTIRL